MGFLNLELFNIALLGKHGWNLIMKLESLCACVLKGKYFPQSDFMAATVPKCASATWRAICAGKQALGDGLVKQIGDGTSVSIWMIAGCQAYSPYGQLLTLVTQTFLLCLS